jgi:hypothetical protein
VYEANGAQGNPGTVSNAWCNNGDVAIGGRCLFGFVGAGQTAGTARYFGVVLDTVNNRMGYTCLPDASNPGNDVATATAVCTH